MEKQQIIFGFGNTYHDPAFCLLKGEEVFAQAMERDAGIKRALMLGSPFYSLTELQKFCQDCDESEVFVKFLSAWAPSIPLSIIGSLWASYARWRSRLPLRRQKPKSSAAFFEEHMRLPQIWYMDAVPIFQHFIFDELFPEKDVSLKFRRILHHRAHAANAVFTGPFAQCAVMILDGGAELSASSFFHFDGKKIRRILYQRDSLGLLYGNMTEFCGFSMLRGEEWKMMGLAAYGERDERIRQFFWNRVSINGLKYRLHFKKDCFEQLEKAVGGFRKKNSRPVMEMAHLAHNFQNFFEEFVGQLAGNFYKLGYSQNLAFGGGCALNSKLNGRLLGLSGFKKLHVPSAPADDGNALGVALYEKYGRDGSNYKPQVMSPYLGSKVDPLHVEKLLSHGKLQYQKIPDEEQLCDYVSTQLAQGKIVGWMQGRAEWGPRALGNRSILAHPGIKSMKRKINEIVKFREAYRPVAPSILDEFGDKYFLNYRCTPYMEAALEFRPEVQEQVTAVVHEDGTGRVQSIQPQWNPLFDKLVRSFYQKTGIPMVINTSLNIMGKPIAHSAEDAITIFSTTALDAMVIGNFVLSKS